MLFGFPFKKTHLGIPFVLLALWIGLSLVPLETAWLSSLTPTALALRGDGPAPSSLAPFMTFRSLWMALACFALVFVGVPSIYSSVCVAGMVSLSFGAGLLAQRQLDSTRETSVPGR